MADQQVSSALAELLLLLRPLIDGAVSSVAEGDPVGAPLDEFQAAIQALSTKEPDVWQLRIVECIYDRLRASCAARNGDDGEDNALEATLDAAAERQDREAEALEQATRTVCKAIHSAAVQISGVVDQALSACALSGDMGGQGEEGSDCRRFMRRVWDELSAISAATERHARREEAAEEHESASNVEVFSFDDESQEDDGQFEDSTPTADSISSLVERMQGVDAVDRAAALDEFAQVPGIFQVLHYTTQFPNVVRAVVELFLQADANGIAVAYHAKRVLYQLLRDCEDPYQFLDVYWAVVEFVGARLSAGELFLSKYTALEATDPASVRVADTFRVLLLLLERVPLHWIHFSPEMLAKVFLSTFQVLTMHSKRDMEVEVAHARPLVVLACLEEYPRWLKVWLLKAPSRSQIFLALEEVGLVKDCLQQLTVFQPLAEAGGGLQHALEKRTTRYLLTVMSLVSEYVAGRELIQQWRRLPVHEELRSRVTAFTSCRLRDVIPVSSENNRLYRLEKDNSSQRSATEKDDTKDNQQDTLTAIIWSVISTVLASVESTASDSRECTLSQSTWESLTLRSVARLIAHHAADELLESLLTVLQGCSEPVDAIDACRRRCGGDYVSWRPFRDPKSALEASQLVTERVLSANPSRDATSLCSRSWMIVGALLSCSALTERMAESPSAGMAPLFQLWQDYLVLSLQEAASCLSAETCARVSTAVRCAPQLLVWAPASGLTTLAIRMLNLSSVFSGKEDGDAACELYTAALVALASSAGGFRLLCSVGLVSKWSKRLVHYMTEQVSRFHGAVSFATGSRDLTREFLASEFITGGLYRAIADLRDSGDFSIAMSSSCDECPAPLRLSIRWFGLIRCWLASPFAPDEISSTSADTDRVLVEFLRETLSRHGSTCGANSDAEDTCCVAFQFVMALVSAIPSKLRCCGLLSDLGLLDLDGGKVSAPVDSTTGIGACSYLELKLRHELETVGGPSERARWRDLHSVDSQTLADAAVSLRGRGDAGRDQVLSRSLGASNGELKQRLAPGLDSATLLDSVSQLAWELIVELERDADTHAATSGLGGLLLAVIKSGLSPIANESASLERTDSVPTASKRSQFPPATQRKLLNRLYKSYCRTLLLPSFPTKLHGVFKHFGGAAIDCFPVTMLMLLGDASEDDGDVLCALEQCYTNPRARYVWPATATASTTVDAQAAPPSIALAEAVEWILARDFPQVLHSVRLCHCSVAALVTRWHSQSFWNYFDWDALAACVSLTLIYGADFQVYTMVAVLLHVESEMRELGGLHTAESWDACLELLERPIAGFRFSECKHELLRLRAAYQDHVLKTLASS